MWLVNSKPASQSLPPGLPIKVDNRSNFIGIITNHYSNCFIRKILHLNAHYLPNLQVKALKVVWGLEKYFPVLLRSDHKPFWEANIPALMWTDTAEFSNPNYHKITDTPETLNYLFLKQVTQLLLLHTVYMTLSN